MSVSLNGLIPEFRPWAYQLLLEAGRRRLQPRITSTRRSRATQTRLYRAYLRGENPYPVAPPGTSAHEFGYAMDMVVSPMEALPSLGSLWRGWGGLWGSHDPIHFEFPGFPHSAQATAEAEAVQPAFWSAVERAADYASFFVTPLSVGRRRGRPFYQRVASILER